MIGGGHAISGLVIQGIDHFSNIFSDWVSEVSYLFVSLAKLGDIKRASN